MSRRQPRLRGFVSAANKAHNLRKGRGDYGPYIHELDSWPNFRLDQITLSGRLAAVDRQRLMVDRLLNGFEGKLTSSKWAKIAKCSPDTGLRDIEGLIAQGILKKDAAGGRSTSYSLTDAKAMAGTG